ncbi:nitroreductase [Xanthomonadaceae bacterium XH05]|nr:nitroreductase [Xanthomonadaceae bacterium XH05]
MSSLDFLNQRRSTPSRQLGLPGPSPDQLRTILAAAMRVPDHGKLAPWRILAIDGEARFALGRFAARRALQIDPAAPAATIEKDHQRFAHAPLVLTVIAAPQPHPKVPEIEQILSAGSVCFALLQAAQALGFGAQWLTGWPAYDDAVGKHLGLTDGESIVGFIHVGTAKDPTPERVRPAVDSRFSVWCP